MPVGVVLLNQERALEIEAVGRVCGRQALGVVAATPFVSAGVKGSFPL